MKQISLFLTLFLTLSVVTPAKAAEMQLRAQDSVAGLGTQIELENFPVGQHYTVLVTPPERTAQSFPVQITANGTASIDIPGSQTEKSGIYTVSLTKEGNTLPQNTSFTILPETLDVANASVDVTPSSIYADGQDTAQIAVVLRDPYGNPLPHRPLELISGRTQDTVIADTKETDENGEQFFSLSTSLAGHTTLRVVDLLTGESLDVQGELIAEQISPVSAPYPPSPWGNAGYTYTPTPYPSPYAFNPYAASLFAPPPFPYYAQVAGAGLVDHFEIETDPKTARVDETVRRLTLRAVDAQGQTIRSYNGTVRIFSPTDPDAIVPNFGEYTFEPRDAGRRVFSLALKFSIPGEQILRIQDTRNSSIFGEYIIDVVGKDGKRVANIAITSHQNDQIIRETQITIEGKTAPFVNLLVTGGTQDVRGETDNTGNFSVPVSLNPNQRDFTLRVRDETGRYDSGSLHLILDQNPPEIRSVSFAPQEPESGEQTVIRVETEEDVQSVTLRIEDNTYTLMPVGTASGIYQKVFAAPQSGEYDTEIIVRDFGGNEGKQRARLRVVSPTLSPIIDLRAKAEGNAVLLTWTPLQEPVDEYRVYIGENPEDFSNTLETGTPTSAARVSGLKPAATYFFTVTGIQGEREGRRGTVVQAQTTGIQLDVEPRENALLLHWTFPSDIALSGFTLEYGTQENYTEKRNLQGELLSYTIRDLINGVPYSVRLTPVTVTGELLSENAATVSGTPIGSQGFFPSPTTPFPILPDTEAPLSPRPPITPANGPSFLWWLIAGLSTGTVLWIIRNIHKRRIAFTRFRAALPQ